MLNKINLHTFATCSLIALTACNAPALANAGPAAPQCDQAAKKADDKFVKSDSAKLTLSGWVNRAIQWADNGFHSNTSYVSPGNVTSNLQITGMYDPVPDWTVGTQFQIDFNQNGTAGATTKKTVLVDIHRAQSNSESENSLSVRQAEFSVDSKKFGKLSVGRGYMASSGVIYYTDLSGTYFFLHPYSSIGGISFRHKKTGTPFNPNPQTGGKTTLKPGILIFEPGDGGGVFGRNDRIRFDSPNFYGFNFSTSHSYQNIGDLFDFALKFAAPLGGTIVTAQVSWARNYTRDPFNGANLVTSGLTLAQIFALQMNPNSVDLGDIKGPRFDTLTYAAGVLFPCSFSGKEMTGLNFHFSGANRKWKIHAEEDGLPLNGKQENGLALQGKIGFLDYFFPIGKTAMVASYGQWRAMDVDFFDPTKTMIGTNWGAGIVQTIDVVGASVYLRYDNYKLKVKHSDDHFKPVNIVYAGALIKL